MLNALKGLGHNQFEFARWGAERVRAIQDHSRRGSFRTGKALRYRYSEPRRHSDNTLLRTAYIYDYKPQQHVMFRNKWWEIVSVNEITQDVAPQTLRLVNGGNRQVLA